MLDQRESQAVTWSEPCTTLDPATLSGLPLIFGSDLRRRPTAADRCDAATRASGHRFVVMPQVLWQTMMREFPAAHVVTGVLPSEDAAAGLGKVRGSLLGRLASALPVSGMYAIAEIVERDGTHVQCALASASDAAELAAAVGATVCYSRWASRRSFPFDDEAAKAIERALSCHPAAEALPQGGKPLAFP